MESRKGQTNSNISRIHHTTYMHVEGECLCEKKRPMTEMPVALNFSWSSPIASHQLSPYDWLSPQPKNAICQSISENWVHATYGLENLFQEYDIQVRLRLVHHSNLLSCEIHLRHIVVDNFIPCRAWSLLVSVSVPAEMWDFKLQLRPYSIFYLFLVQSIAHNLVEGTRGKSRGNEFHLLSLSTRFQRYGIRILHM